MHAATDAGAHVLSKPALHRLRLPDGSAFQLHPSEDPVDLFESHALHRWYVCMHAATDAGAHVLSKPALHRLRSLLCVEAHVPL